MLVFCSSQPQSTLTLTLLAVFYGFTGLAGFVLTTPAEFWVPWAPTGATTTPNRALGEVTVGNQPLVIQGHIRADSSTHVLDLLTTLSNTKFVGTLGLTPGTVPAIFTLFHSTICSFPLSGAPLQGRVVRTHSRNVVSSSIFVVGAAGFEPATLTMSR